MISLPNMDVFFTQISDRARRRTLNTLYVGLRAKRPLGPRAYKAYKIIFSTNISHLRISENMIIMIHE